MATEDNTPQEEPEADAYTEADGYYGDDEATDEELDLSFLDEDDDKDEKPVR